MYTEPFPFGKWVDWDLGRGSSAGSSRFPSGGMGTYTSYPYARSLWVLSTYISNVFSGGMVEKRNCSADGRCFRFACAAADGGEAARLGNYACCDDSVTVISINIDYRV